MKGFNAFLKKEFIESVRSYKLWIILIVFGIFGIMSPLFAKITPELIKMLADDSIQITMKDPTALDSYMQFFKNVSQMGLILFIIIFSATLSSEIKRGTLIPLLSKGLSRNAVIMSKYLIIVIIWSISLVSCFLIAYVYTILLFPQMEINNLLFSVACLWIFGCFLIALFLWGSLIISTSYGGLLISAIVLGVLMFMNMVPVIQNFNPITLMSSNVAMLDPHYIVSDIYPAIIINTIAIILLNCMSILIFRKKQL